MRFDGKQTGLIMVCILRDAEEEIVHKFAVMFYQTSKTKYKLNMKTPQKLANKRHNQWGFFQLM